MLVKTNRYMKMHGETIKITFSIICYILLCVKPKNICVRLMYESLKSAHKNFVNM